VQNFIGVRLKNAADGIPVLADLFNGESGKAFWRRGAGLCAGYVLSLLSQPVSLFFPVWLVPYFLWNEDPSRKRFRPQIAALLLLLLAAMLLFLVLNRRHYAAFYLAHEANTQKPRTLEFTSIRPASEALLAVGRYLFQLVMPWKFAAHYSAGSRENLIGLVLLPIAAWFSGRALGWRRAMLAWSFFLILLALVILKIRTLFISDTYLLCASLGIWFLALAAWQRYHPRLPSRARTLIFLLVASLFLAKSYANARTWLSDELMWKNSFETEGSCFSSMNYALILFKRDRIPEAEKVADSHFLNHCLDEISRPLYYVTIFHHSGISLAEKIALLTKESDKYPTRLAILAALLLQNGQAAKADAVIAELLLAEPKFWLTLHRIETQPLQDACRSASPGTRACKLAQTVNPNVD
jgi:hypothetical protein